MNINKTCLHIFFGLILAVSLMVSGCASTDGNGETERLYSPVALYFNPLEHLCPFEWVVYFPIFENYPDDLTKYGLHGKPLSVSNQFYSPEWGVKYQLEVMFSGTGNLEKTLNTAWKFGNEYNYDQDGKLLDIVYYDDSNSHYHDSEQRATFIYDGSRLEQWKGPAKFNQDLFPGLNIKSYRYEYYPDSILKAVVPVCNGKLSNKSKTGTYEFNEKEQLIRMITPRSSNPFFKTFAKDGYNVNSEVEFQYNSKGQCVVKEEKLFVTKIRKGETVTDTLSAYSHYDYNDNNDLVKWTYKGITVEDSKEGILTSVSDLTIEYEYQYDDQGNWITAWCILPKDFKSYSALTKFYRSVSDFSSDSEKNDGRLAIRFIRSISGYSNSSLSEDTSQQEEQNSEGEPKYSGVQAYGLQGPVKMVTNETNKQTTVFNQIGNIESFISANGYRDCNVSYIYENPFRYKSGNIQYRIECVDNILRLINEPDEETFEFEDEYRFDSKGRVISHVWYDGMSRVTREYIYQGDSRLPSKEIESSFDESGEWSTTFEYKYIDIDKHGNWTKRIAISTLVSNDYEEIENENGEFETATKNSESTDEFEEIRKITYY